MGDLDAALQSRWRSPKFTSAPKATACPGEQFNGFDPIETYDVGQRAMERAR